MREWEWMEDLRVGGWSIQQVVVEECAVRGLWVGLWRVGF